MNYLYPFISGFCLIASACAGANQSADQLGLETAGNGDGTAGALSVGGDTSSAGSTELGGATGDNGGANPTAGASADAGSSAGGLGHSGGQGGTSAQGGGGPMGSSGAGGGGPSPPIDYSIWVLQLPTGSAGSITTISSQQLLAGFSNAYFYPAMDGGQIFMDPAMGATTSGSTRCRTEMRETNATGGQAAWSSTGTNSMTVAGQVLKVGGGSSGTVTLGQLFNGTDSIPLIEFEYSTSAKGFKAFYEEAKGAGTTIDLKTPVALNTRYSFTLALSKGVLSVGVNGKNVYTHTPSAGILAKKFYFKFGNYDQTTSAGTAGTTPYTVVEAYDVSVVHQ